jgi:hypothetical protein
VRIVWTAVVVVACAFAGVGAPLDAAGEASSVNYGVRLAGPVDGAGRSTHRRVPVGVPFWLRVELFTDGMDGAASVSYDLYMPTDFKLVLKRLRLPNGAATSSCLRACTVGWNSARSHRLFVYYAVVPPVAAEFMVAARIVATNHKDTRRSDDTGRTMIVAVPARLAFGTPQFESGPPVEGRTFQLAFAVNRSGTPVSPTGVRCLAAVRGRSRPGVAVSGYGRVRCAWGIPPRSNGTTLRTTVKVTAGSLHAATSWAFAIRASR